MWSLAHCPSSRQTDQPPEAKMKTSGMRRALALANVFNLLVAIYFIVISIISLVQLRWYHQLTITTRVRHIITSTTSYFAFLILLAVAIVLVAIFVIGSAKLSTKIYISSFKNQDATKAGPLPTTSTSTPTPTPPPMAVGQNMGESSKARDSQQRKRLLAGDICPPAAGLTMRESSGSICGGGLRQATVTEEDLGNGDSSANFCSMLLNLIAAIGLIVVIVIWLLNTGELVRDSISTQLDFAFARYQFSNRSNHYSVAIDAMQNINICCGSLDYTDFPHQRVSGLSTGHYPGSCCGKNIFGVMARVLCAPEEIVRARQTTGCVIAIANHYDLVSLLIVPVALTSLFVCIMVMAMMTLLKGQDPQISHQHQSLQQTTNFHGPRFISTSVPDKLELSTTPTTSKLIKDNEETNNNPMDLKHHEPPATETVSNH